MYEAKLNERALYDAFLFGLVPCKILARENGKFKIRITARKNKYYQYGEILTVFTHSVLPRACIYVRNGKYHCRAHVWDDSSLKGGHGC